MPGVSLLHADDAAQVFVFNIFRSKVDKLSVHIRPVPFVIYNCRMPLTSYSDGSTAHAMRRTASDGAFISGTHITSIPAAYAAWTPASLSSSTRQSSARSPAFSRALRKHPDAGLAVLDLGAEDHIVKVPVHAVCAQHAHGAVTDAGGSKDDAHSARFELLQQFLSAGLQRYAAVEIYLFI